MRQLITILLIFATIAAVGQSRQKRVWIGGGEYIWTSIDVDSTGAIRTSWDVYLQDQTTDVVDLYLCRDLGEAVIKDTALVNTRRVVLQPGHGFVVGNYLCMRNNGSWYQGRAISISGDTIIVDMPLNHTYSAGTTIKRTSPDMNVNGATTPVTFRIYPTAGHKWDITRILILIRDDAAMDDGKFGALAELANGLVIRAKRSDAAYENIFAARSNGSFANRTYDAQYIDATLGPSGQYSLRIRRTFGGQDKNGVVVRLDGDQGGEFQAIVQDNLTGLTHFRIIAQGHVVE